MWTAPCRRTEHDLDLLPSGKAPHGIVRDEFGLEAKIGKVLFDFPTHKGTEEA
jgi:hypothetical protein